MEIIRAEEAHSRQIYELTCELENQEMDEECFYETYMENLNDPKLRGSINSCAFHPMLFQREGQARQCDAGNQTP